MRSYGTGLAAAFAVAVVTCAAAGAATKCSSGDRLVTVNPKTKTYYVSHRTLNTSQSVMTMCEKRARAAGYHMSRSSMRKTRKRMIMSPQMNRPLPSATPTLQTNPNNEQNGIQTTPTPNPQRTG